MNYQERLEKRFYRYAAITSQSDGGAGSVPSTKGQLELGRLLSSDMAELGVKDISISDSGVVTGNLPSNLKDLGISDKGVPTVGWVCHLDTVDIKMSPDIHPITIRNYQGGDILQNKEKNLYIKIAEHPELNSYIGQDIVVSDGTSVLGADNKAAIANIMTALELLNEDSSIPHGTIYIAFVPDEEIGLRGSKSMDFSKFPVDFAYTIDCCGQGELVYETFNAAYAVVNFKGVPAHPMSSKNNLVNPAIIAVDFINLLDRAEMPEHTENKEGYLWVTDIFTDEVTGRINIDIRDHNLEKFNGRKAFLEKAVDMTNLKHPKAEMTLEIHDLYSNIADALNDDNKMCVDYLYRAMKDLGIEPNTIAMRGGTDGSFISSQGIPTPNYFTGAHNFHSPCEFLPLGAMENSLKVTMRLISLIAGHKTEE